MQPTYDDLSSRLLAVSPLLAAMGPQTTLNPMISTYYSHLSELNEIDNGFLQLLRVELPDVKFSNPRLLPKIGNWQVFQREYERLSISVEELRHLYLQIAHIKSIKSNS